MKEATGDWKAIVLRSNDDDERDALLSSEPCETVQKAFESLHAKAAEATSVYIKTNGFKSLHNPNNDVDDLSDDGTTSVASSRSDDTSVALSVFDSSDDDVVKTASSSSKKKKSSKRSKARHTRKYGSTNSSECELPGGPPNRRMMVEPGRLPGMRQPPPPAAFGGPRPPPYNVDSRGVQVHRGPSPPLPHFMHPGANGPAFPAPPVPGPAPGMRPVGIPPRLHDVRITINWLYHGEQRIFESTRPSIRALQDTTVAYIRGHMNVFDNVTPLDHSPNKVWTLRANVKQAFFGTEAYDMSGYRGDDLTKLFNVVGKNDIPRFEMEVDYVRPPGGMPMHGPSVVPLNPSLVG